MTAEIGTPTSNRPRSRARSRLLLQACFIGPLRGVARGGAFLFLLPRTRERSAGTAQITSGTSTKAPACRVTGRRALRRSNAAIFVAITVLLGSDRRDFPSRYPGSNRRRPSSDPVQPLKAAPSSGADDDRASWDGVTSPACRRRTLLRPPSVPSRRPRLSKAWRQYRV